ncbi:phage tail tape measure protein [Cryobacterium sp. Hh7]|nr:phage tail tape measure protein [Cryobacterium sp. Hh7]
MTAQVTGYLQGMEKARKATSDAGTAAEKAARQVEEQNQAMQSAGRGLMAVGVVAIAATALSVKAAIGWQSAWAGVTKTVSGTPAELAKVEEGLRTLAKTLPSSHDEIAAVAEAAGQLGIKTGSVVAFTNTMIDLGETTNLSADQAATSLARFMNIMGTSQEDVSRLGSTIVALGNNYATTEAEIVAMSMRLAGAGRQIGLSEGEVLGLSTALSSVGIEAEAGGSAFSTLMVNIASEVETGGDKLDLFAKTSGKSAEDFAAQWKSDPAEALAGFIEGLGGVEEQGGSTLQTLADLGVTEIRMRDALLRASAASDMFTGAMNDGNTAFDENNALAAEAAQRYATVESQLQVMSNRVSDAAISFGQVFLPAVSAASEGIGDMADFLGALDPKMQGAIATVALLGGGVALAGGVFLLALPKIAAFQVSLGILATSSMPAVAASAAGMMAATTRATTAMAASAKFMTGPWGLAIAASAVGIGALTSYLDSLRDSAAEVENSMKTARTAADIFESVGNGREWTAAADVTAQLNDLPKLLQEAANQSSNLWDRVSGREYHGAIIALKDIGEELADTARVDLPEAQRQFALLAAETDGTDQSLWRLLASMPAYKDALTEQASAQDINVNSTSEATNKTNLLKLANRQAAPVALTAAEAYLAAADETAGLSGELTTLIDTLNEANGVGQDAISQNINYQSALADVDAQIAEIAKGTEGYSLGVNANTEAGRTNLGMLNDLASSSQDAAKAQHDLDNDTANYKTTLEAGRQAVIDRAVALGATADEAQILADKIYAIPSDKQFTMIAQTAEATDKLARFLRDLNNIPGRRDVVINQVVRQTGAARGEVAAAYGRATGGTVYGPGTGTSDSIPVMLSNGEEVTRASMAEKYRPLLKAINADRVPGYASGGSVGYATAPQYVTQGGGWRDPGASMSTTDQSTQITIQGDVGYDPETIAREITREKRKANAGAGIGRVVVA